MDYDAIASVIQRHQRVAFQFSGGRDSTAALYYMRPFWDRFVVYHLDTGDQFPETAGVVAQVEANFGQFIRIESSVEAIRAMHGHPTDLMPVDNQAGLGQAVSGARMRLMPRYECCFRTLMAPMYQRMVNDGVTLIVRGQRDSEFARPLARSGFNDGVHELLFPIQSWTDGDVMEFLDRYSLPVAPFYDEGMTQAPECMGCTAWLNEGRFDYMRKHHPREFKRVIKVMRSVKQEVDRQYRAFEAVNFKD